MDVSKSTSVSASASVSALGSVSAQVLLTDNYQKSLKLPRRIKIEPAFAEDGTRVVVKVTHFNNKKFEGFVSQDDAKHQIFQAIGLKLNNHHGSTFQRDEDDSSLLKITFRLKQPISKDCLHRCFWYLKESNAGVDDMISGEVIFPSFEDFPVNYGPTVVGKVEPGTTLRIYGCDYKLSESQIRAWIEAYGKVEGSLEEEAVSDESDGTSMGTGTCYQCLDRK
jgi:hypothetical protein